jgi:hypothetical protein
MAPCFWSARAVAAPWHVWRGSLDLAQQVMVAAERRSLPVARRRDVRL